MISSKTNKPNQTVEQTIMFSYNQYQNSLNIAYKPDMYLSALEHRDWSMLLSLCLQGCCVNDENIKAIIQRQWPNLLSLQLEDNQVTQKGVLSILNLDVPKLTQLSLGIAGVRNQTKIQSVLKGQPTYLLWSKTLNSYRSSISSCSIVAKECNFTLNFTNKLKRLNLTQNDICSIGAKMLSKSNFNFLQELWLSGCCIGNAGVKHLSKAYLPHLKQTSFNDNMITYDGFCWTPCLMLSELDQLHIWSINSISLAIFMGTNCRKTTRIYCSITDYSYPKNFSSTLRNRFINQ